MKKVNVRCPNCGSTHLEELEEEEIIDWSYIKTVFRGDLEGTEYKYRAANVKYICKECHWPVPIFNPSKRVPRKIDDKK